mmetsp:Transcript_3875/g.11233  ORF Transcript_3875/g.11233 Transcript_3875/m.11233 type:complete len:320 (+) Transcript_3875:951-1910(+)
MRRCVSCRSSPRARSPKARRAPRRSWPRCFCRRWPSGLPRRSVPCKRFQPWSSLARSQAPSHLQASSASPALAMAASSTPGCGSPRATETRSLSRASRPSQRHCAVGPTLGTGRKKPARRSCTGVQTTTSLRPSSKRAVWLPPPRSGRRRLNSGTTCSWPSARRSTTACARPQSRPTSVPATRSFWSQSCSSSRSTSSSAPPTRCCAPLLPRMRPGVCALCLTPAQSSRPPLWTAPWPCPSRPKSGALVCSRPSSATRTATQCLVPTGSSSSRPSSAAAPTSGPPLALRLKSWSRAALVHSRATASRLRSTTCLAFEFS